MRMHPNTMLMRPPAMPMHPNTMLMRLLTMRMHPNTMLMRPLTMPMRPLTMPMHRDALENATLLRKTVLRHDTSRENEVICSQAS